MKYCESCGKQIKENSNFCPYCGKNILGNSYNEYHIPESREPEPISKLYLELAYTGVLFWLPLVFSEDENRKIHANRGLWTLILAVIACTIGNIIRYSLLSFGTVGVMIINLFILPLLLFMFFLAANSFKQAMAIHNDEI